MQNQSNNRQAEQYQMNNKNGTAAGENELNSILFSSGGHNQDGEQVEQNQMQFNNRAMQHPGNNNYNAGFSQKSFKQGQFYPQNGNYTNAYPQELHQQEDYDENDEQYHQDYIQHNTNEGEQQDEDYVSNNNASCLDNSNFEGGNHSDNQHGFRGASTFKESPTQEEEDEEGDQGYGSELKVQTMEMFGRDSIHSSLYGKHNQQIKIGAKGKQSQQQQQQQQRQQQHDELQFSQQQQFDDQEIVNVLNNIHCPFNEFSLTSNSNNSTPQKGFPMQKKQSLKNKNSKQNNNQQVVPQFHLEPHFKAQQQQNDEGEQEENIEDDNQEHFEEDDEQEDQDEKNLNFGWRENVVKTNNHFPLVNVPTMELSNENSGFFSHYQSRSLQPSFLQKQQENLEQNRLKLEQNQQHLLSNVYFQEHMKQQQQQQHQQHQQGKQIVQKQIPKESQDNSTENERFRHQQLDYENQQHHSQTVLEQESEENEKNGDYINQQGYYEGEAIQSQNISRSQLEQDQEYRQFQQNELEDQEEEEISNNNHQNQKNNNSRINQQQQGQDEEGNDVEVTKSRIQEASAEKELDRLRQQLIEKDKNVRHLQYENEQLFQRANEAEEKCQLLIEKYKDQGNLEQLRGKKLQVSQQDLQKLRAQLNKKDGIISELTDRLEQLEVHSQEMEAAVEKELRQAHQESKRQKVVHASYVKRIEDYETEIQQIQMFAQQNSEENAERISRLEQDLNALRQQTRMREIQREEEQAQFEQTLCEVERLQSVIVEKEKEEVRTSEKIQELRNQLDVVMLQKHDAEEFRENNNHQIGLGIDDTGKQQQQKMNMMDEEIARIKKGYEREIAKLKEQLALEKMKQNEFKETKEQVVVEKELSELDKLILGSSELEQQNLIQEQKIAEEKKEIEQKKVNLEEELNDTVLEFWIGKLNELGISKEFNMLGLSDKQGWQNVLSRISEQLHEKIMQFRQGLLERTNQDEKIVQLQSEIRKQKKDIEELNHKLLAIRLDENDGRSNDKNNNNIEVIRQLQDTVHNLEETIQTLDQNKKQQSQDILDLQAEIQESQQQYNIIVEENELLQNHLSHLEQGMEELRNEIEKKEISKGHRGVENQLSERIENMAERLKEKELNLTELAIQKQQYYQEAEYLKAKLKKMEEQKDRNQYNSSEEIIRNELERQKLESEKLRKDIEKFKQETQKIKQDKTLLENQLAAQTNCLRMVEKERDLLAEERKDFQGIREENKLKNEEVKQLVKISKDNESNLVMKANNFEKENEQLNNEILELRSHLEESKREKELCQREKERIEKESREKDKKNIELFGNVKSLTQQTATLDQTIQSLKIQLETAKKQTNLKNVDLKNAQTKSSELHNLNTQLQAQIQTLRNTPSQNEKTQTSNNTQHQIKNSEQKFVSLEAEIMELNLANESLHEKLEHYAISNQDLIKHNELLQNQLQDLDETNEKLTQEIDRLNHQIQLLNQKSTSQSAVFSPEMLSSEETIEMMLEILRRTSKSIEMTRSLANSDEFIDLIEQLRLINASTANTISQHSNRVHSNYSSNNNSQTIPRVIHNTNIFQSPQNQPIMAQNTSQSQYIQMNQHPLPNKSLPPTPMAYSQIHNSNGSNSNAQNIPNINQYSSNNTSKINTNINPMNFTQNYDHTNPQGQHNHLINPNYNSNTSYQSNRKFDPYHQNTQNQQSTSNMSSSSLSNYFSNHNNSNSASRQQQYSSTYSNQPTQFNQNNNSLMPDSVKSRNPPNKINFY